MACSVNQKICFAKGDQHLSEVKLSGLKACYAEAKNGAKCMSYPLQLEIPVAWGEMDAFQHVNNTVYFKWCESARIAYFAKIGFLELHKTEDIGPILASIQCRFRAPLFYPDTVQVEVRMARLGAQDFELHYRIESQQQHLLAAEAQDRCVVYNYAQGCKTEMPQSLRQAILSLQPELAA